MIFSHQSSLFLCLQCMYHLVKVIVDKSFVFSKEVINALYLSGTDIIIFSTSLESRNSFPNNFILLAIPNNLFEYYLIVSDSFILCISNSLINFKTFMPRIFSFPSYSTFKYSQISLGDFRVMILVIIICETPANKHDFAFAFFGFLSLCALI